MGICDNNEERQALVVAGHLNAVHIELVELVRGLESSGAWAVDGVRSLPHWLGWQLGLSNAEAARAVTVAAAFDTHPELCGMFADGRLSIAQTALAVTVDPTRDHELAQLAVACTLSQLRVFVKVMKTSDTPRPAADPEPRREHFDFGLDGDGWLNGRFGLDPEHGQLVKHALEQCRDALFHQRATDRPVDPDTDRDVAGPTRVRWSDALAEMARRGLDGELSEVRRDRYRVNLFIDLDDIVNPDSELSTCWITRDGVPAWLTERITCDGTVTPTFTKHGKPVSVGRSQRIVPERTRRLVDPPNVCQAHIRRGGARPAAIEFRMCAWHTFGTGSNASSRCTPPHPNPAPHHQKPPTSTSTPSANASNHPKSGSTSPASPPELTHGQVRTRKTSEDRPQFSRRGRDPRGSCAAGACGGGGSGRRGCDRRGVRDGEARRIPSR